MTDVATRGDGLPADYYAPEMAVEIEGAELDPASRGDVLELKVEMDLEQMASAELKFNNYDDTTFALKWSDSPQFQLGNRIHVRMGYANRMVSMLRGQIATLSPEFPESGAPTLTVRALDGLVRLKASKPPEDQVTYRNLRDWEIAQRVGERNQLQVEVTRAGPVHDLVVQGNVDDAVFLKERARRIDFDVFVQTDPESGEDVLHFVGPTDGRDARPLRVYTLAWGTSLIEFTPTITGAEQVRSVTVRGWDPTRKQAITYTATPETTPGVSGSGEATGPAAAARLAAPEGREDVVVDAPVMSVDEARHLAESHLASRAYEYLTGRGRVIGLPDLRPGDNLELEQLGTRFSGRYYVTKATHALGERGYTTEFEVRKTYDGGTA